MEHSKDPKDRVLSLVKGFNDLRDTLVDGLLDIAVTPETKLWVIKILVDNRLLPFSDYVNECPEQMAGYLEKESDWIDRYRSLSFIDLLNYMTNHKPLSNPELINDCFDYIKEHRVIGTVNDW